MLLHVLPHSNVSNLPDTQQNKLLLLLSLPVVVHAQFNYETNSGGIWITKYIGSGGDVTAPTPSRQSASPEAATPSAEYPKRTQARAGSRPSYLRQQTIASPSGPQVVLNSSQVITSRL